MSWPLVALKDCCTVVGGATPRREVESYWDSKDVPWVTPKDISKINSLYINDAPEYISNEGFDSCAACKLPIGSLLLTSRAPIGNIAITTKEMCTNQGFKSLIPSYKVDVKYLYFCMLHSADRLENEGNGATFKEVSKKIVEAFKIPLPPLETQKQIAAVLEKADQLRKDCQQMEQELNNLAQSVFIEMFGDPVTNPRGFDSKPLRELVSVLSGATPSKSNDNFWIGNVPWVSPKDMKVPEIYDSIDHVNEIAFTETNLKKIPLNSILIVVRGMILVHTVPLAITRKNLSINQDIKALTVKCNSIKSEFLLAVLSSMHSHLLSIISTAAHGTKRIDMADLLDLKIIVPSIQQQDQFIKTVITMRNMTATQQAEATLYENNFNALMQKAFSGELNLANAKT